MKFIHHIFFESNETSRRTLASLGIIVGHGFVSFDFDEADLRWPRVSTWIKAYDASDTVYTRFSDAEISGAPWLELIGEWHYGYPQPDEENLGYRDVTYDQSETCKKCNMPLKQEAPFQIRGEPKWGRRGIFQLNWVFDEFFVKPDVWTNIFKDFDVACRPVLNKKGQELKTVVQLVTNQPEVDFDTSGLKFGQCKTCRRVKYLPDYRGPFPQLLQEPSGPMVRTKQYFGSDAQSFKGIIISQGLAQRLISKKIRGIAFKPIAEKD
jgi:hypothetical protein